MRSLLRHPFAVLSLLLSIMAAGMWVRSYWVSDSIPRVVEANRLQLHSAYGRLILVGTRQVIPKPGQVFDAHMLTIGQRKVPLAGIDKALREQLIEERGSLKLRQIAIRTEPAQLGNGFGFDAQLWALGPWYVVVPYWLVVGLLAFPAAVVGAGAIRRRRRSPGGAACPRCGQAVPAGHDRCLNCPEAPATTA